MSSTRWIVCGTLKVLSPLSIRTGDEEDDWPAELSLEPNAIPPSDRVGAAPVAAIELDYRHRPFLPGSAIKGLLRAIASSSLGLADLDRVTRLLGHLPQPGLARDDASAKVATGGLAVFGNAFRSEPSSGTPASSERPAARGRTALHEGSRTAEDGQLRHDRFVAPETSFEVSILLVGACEADVALLLGLLRKIDGADQQSALGSGTTQGDGRIAWALRSVRRFGAAEVVAWLEAAHDKAWTDFAIEAQVAPEPVWHSAIESLELPLTIQIDGHFLVSAHDQDTSGTTLTYPRRPLRHHGSDEATAHLPGSSLDGAIRSQARRVFRTMSGDHDPWPPDDTILPASFEILFGSARRASLLAVGHFAASGLRCVTQDFVALDRLTGASADGKKFDLRAFESPALAGSLRLVLQRRVETALTGKAGMTAQISLTPAALGLLALTLKDLACGDVSLGHATRKGYGGVASVSFGGLDWRAFLLCLGARVADKAPGIPALSTLARRDGRAVIETAVQALEDEAKAWRNPKAPTAGQEATG